MELGEIISDAITYPLHNIKSFLIYVLIGVVGGILGGSSIIGMIGAIAGKHFVVAGGFGVLGILIAVVASLLISGYTLDIVKYGIERRNDGPGIDFVRQILNAIKLIVVSFVYYFIPVVIGWILGFLLGSGILTIIITIAIYVLFALAQYMAVCRLAKYDSLEKALAIREAIDDISKVGVIKLLVTVLIIILIAVVIGAILVIIFGYQPYVGGVLLGIFGVYLVFFYNRAIGLLYSDVH